MTDVLGTRPLYRRARSPAGLAFENRGGTALKAGHAVATSAVTPWSDHFYLAASDFVPDISTVSFQRM
jgi:hypothetical protein